MEIEWIVSDHQRPALATVVDVAGKVLPPWVAEMVIRYDPRLDAIARVSSNVEYRNVIVQIGDQWFSESEPNRLIHILHEFSHGIVAPVLQVHDSVKNAYTAEDSPERKIVEESMRIAEESAVSDLSRIFYRLLTQGSGPNV